MIFLLILKKPLIVNFVKFIPSINHQEYTSLAYLTPNATKIKNIVRNEESPLINMTDLNYSDSD